MWKRSHIHQAHFWYYIISALNPVQKLSNLGISFKEDCMGWRCFIRLKSYPSTEKDFNVEKLSIICPYNYIMTVRGTGVPRAISRFLDTEMANIWKAFLSSENSLFSSSYILIFANQKSIRPDDMQEDCIQKIKIFLAINSDFLFWISVFLKKSISFASLRCFEIYWQLFTDCLFVLSIARKLFLKRFSALI